MPNRPIRILLVEDNPADADLLKEQLIEECGEDAFDLVHAESLAEALDRLSKQGVDVVLLDLLLPDSHGLETFTAVYTQVPGMPIVVLSGFDDETTAAKAVREGAQDYLVKGQVDGHMLLRSMRYAMERTRPEANFLQNSAVGAKAGMVGKSHGFKKAMEFVGMVAKTSNTSVLLRGETGTGKGRVAEAIHKSSNRRDKPFFNLNCSAIPENLLEAEMFGYEKGAFTDAKQAKKGLFELADGGTIFLDEIGDMDVKLQPKLLQFLESRTIRRVGGVTDIRVDVRVIAATNKNLETLVREKKFREDLYYRLKVMDITIPPLRERKMDIPALTEHYLREFAGAHKKNVKGLTKACMEAFTNYSWPGNIRELRNVIERAVILADSEELGVEDLPMEIASACELPDTAALPAADASLAEMEKAHIVNVITKVNGNKTQAAKILGISRLTLRNKLKSYGIED